MTRLSQIQAQFSYAATETHASKKDDGRRDLSEVKEDREDLRTEMIRRREEAYELEEALREAADQDFFEKVGNFFSGSDGGVGELSDQIQANAAELERAQHQLELAKAESSDLLKELETANKDFDEVYAANEEMLNGDRKIRQQNALA